MASKSKKVKAAQARKDQRLGYWLVAISCSALLIKVITQFRIPGHLWLGADGENYITGFNALITEGLLSKEHLLSYWPAGYPLLIKLVSVVGIQHALTGVVFLQSVFYFAASTFFVLELSKTKLRKFSFLVAIILAYNPTLSLSTLTLGYESISAAAFIMAVALFIREYRSEKRKLLSLESVLAATFLSISSFVQPRFVLSAVILFAIWAISTRPKKTAAAFLIINVIFVAVLPATLVVRNIVANDFAAVSTNLGITMNLGAGPGATGGFIKEGYGVPCEPITGNEAQQDAHLRNCVISWYFHNPVKSAELFFNKARFFWSPWSGPEASGSMARNPWLKINPLVSIATESQSGRDLVFGSVGKLISWIWVTSSLIFAGIGGVKLYRAGGLVRIVGLMAISIVVSNWLISVGTLGDHRQRLPIMTLSLFLQFVGIASIFGGRKYSIADDQSDKN